jgi:hypothetical protein
MKAIKFEKINGKLAKEELSYIKGGYNLKRGDSNGGDTYSNGGWMTDTNGDIRGVQWINGAWEIVG